MINFNVALALTKALKLTDQKTGQVKQWDLYPMQKHVLNQFLSGQSTIVLKIRQVGISTLSLYYALLRAITEPGISIAVVGNNYATSIKLTRDLKGMFDQLGVKIESNSMKHIQLANKSRITTLTAGAPSIGRGSTFSLMILSEAGFYKNSYVAMAALMPSLTLDGQLIYESTAEATDTVFRTVWEDKTSKFKKIFLGLEMHSKYVAEPDSITDARWEELKRLYKFTSRPHAAFWQMKLVQNGGDEILNIKEYPLLPDQAFMAADGLWVKKTPDILPYTKDSKYKDLHIYDTYKPDHIYCASVDTASGGGGDTDDSVIIIYDVGEEKIAASFCSNSMTMDKLTDVAQYLHAKYQYKILIVEKNGIGAGTYEFACKKGLPAVGYDATPESRYRAFLWAKIQVEAGLCADENLRSNCLNCQVVQNTTSNGYVKFSGKKDFLAALGFISHYLDHLRQYLPKYKTAYDPNAFNRPDIMNGRKGQNTAPPKKVFK